MQPLPDIQSYDVHAVIPAEFLPDAIKAISHVKGVVFSVSKHEGKNKTPVCRSRSTENN